MTHLFLVTRRIPIAAERSISICVIDEIELRLKEKVYQEVSIDCNIGLRTITIIPAIQSGPSTCMLAPDMHICEWNHNGMRKRRQTRNNIRSLFGVWVFVCI